MSLVTLIRDYVDVATSTEQLDGYTFSSLAYYTLGFLFSILKQVIVNFCTFQWIRDFSYFCLTPPTLFSSFANINLSEGFPFTPSGLEVGKFINVIDALPSKVLKIEHQSLSNLVAFSETNFLNGIWLVLLGFFNGCFTSIHISAVNLITIQRLLVQGVPAGLCSALGTAIGQCFFLACVHFGFRTFLFPWLSLEPLPFLLGIGILLGIASNSAQDKRTPTIQWSAKSSLLTYIVTSVALAWCEQTALFQLMGNLSFGAEPTLLETTLSFENIETIFGNIQQIIKNGGYLLAFFLGNFLGTFFLAYALQRLLEFLLSFKGIPIYYGLIKQANLPLATLIFAFGFGSLPYYGFDYLITKGFGFIPQEQLFQQTLFSPVNLVSKTSQTKEPTQGRLEDQLALLFTLEGEKNKSFVVDTTPFDDGQYLKAGQKRPQAFEDLNYRGEHLWTNRLSRISNIREQANQTQSSFLGPVFSWMRSFLWGEGSTTSNANNTKNLSTSINSVNNSSLQSKDFPFQSDFGENQKEFTKYQNALKGRKEVSAEGKQIDNYVKEFDRQFDKGFSNYHTAEPLSLMEIEDQWQEQRIKKKCYTNPIYTFLLNIEIDSFLRRQPNYHRLSAEEEILLLKRRQLLSNYYDTLTLTNQVPTSQAFNQLVPKSYTNAIYNHQFKGTLKIARRLFSIKNVLPTLQASDVRSSDENIIDVSSDIPKGSAKLEETKYRDGLKNSSITRNESITSNKNSRPDSSQFRKPTPSGPPSELGLAELKTTEGKSIEKPRVIKFDQPLFSKEKIWSNSGNSQFQNSDHSFEIHESITSNKPFRLPQGSIVKPMGSEQRKILFHEELNGPITNNLQGAQRFPFASPEQAAKTKDLYNKETKLRDKNVFLLQQAESLPLYASWDEELRKLILTNRFQSRIKASYTYSAEQDLPSERVQSRPSEAKGILASRQGKDSHSVRSLVSFTAWPLPNPLHSYPTEIFQKKKIFNEIFEKQGYTFNSKNQFLFPTQSLKEPATNDMINALLEWQKLIKDNKQLSKVDRQAAKEKVSYWPKNVRRANWSTELIDNDIEFDEPTESGLKKQIILWEFIPPNYGGFIWPGIK